MEGPHNTELTRPSAVERSLEELKHLLEGNSCTLGDCRTHSDEDQGDQCTELMANMTALHQKVQELADLNTELRRQEQSVTVRGKGSGLYPILRWELPSPTVTYLISDHQNY
ncbi:hypothetical protein AX15_000016 [Amanita polypyramis BW_CC]|nr:hypothetical protein AX15_000016 [Amanita polypyramis BW_CC]